MTQTITNCDEDLLYTTVKIVVALSDSGQVKAVGLNENNLQARSAYKQLVSDCTGTGRLWTVKVLEIKMPYPATFEKIEVGK